MKTILIAATIIMILVTGAAFAGQNTGGDKKTVTSGLNPQPLPPGRHHYRRRHHKHGRGTAYSPQWGGRRTPSANSNNRPK